MSGSSLTVQCLASTRVTEQTWQEQKSREKSRSNEEDEDEHEDFEGSERDAESISAESGSALRNNNRNSGNAHVPLKTPSLSNSRSDIEYDSTSTSGSSSIDASSTSSNSSSEIRHTSCVQEAQLSPDGTCVFTSDYNRSFSVYPIDNSLNTELGTSILKPYAQFTSSDPIWAFAASPLFDINNANSTLILVSRRDRYITLHNALWDVSKSSDNSDSVPNMSPVDISTSIASYKLVNALTEAITAPLSLTYSHSGTHFFAGSRNSVHIFDLEFPDKPSHTISTIPSARSKLKGGGRGFKGVVSALAVSLPTPFSAAGMLAAGARTRHVGIYDVHSGTEITTFSLPGTVDGKKLVNSNMQHIIGNGVTSLKYSPCGKYLYVAERNSDVLLIYDVRKFSLALGYCAGRKALTKQKLGFDVWNAGASPYDIEAISHEIWAGGTDGMVRVWRDPYVKEGVVEADEVFKLGEGNAPVVGTMVHPSGGLAVGACGSIDVGDEGFRGKKRGGVTRPRFREWGAVDILRLS